MEDIPQALSFYRFTGGACDISSSGLGDEHLFGNILQMWFIFLNYSLPSVWFSAF